MFKRASRGSPFEYVQGWNAEREQKGWWHSFELPDGTQIDGVCSLASLKNRIGRFPIPQDLSGKRVLDIGSWDGWFAFEMERRGADVLAIDNWDNPRFREIHGMLSSRVDYRQLDVYEMTPARVGYFDIVLFMGVLYHLKHPLLALERVCALTKEMAAVDSFVLREKHRPGMRIESRAIIEFYETNEFGGQTDNWVGPSLPCLMAFCRTAGFARVELQASLDDSACIACFRHWEPPRPDPEEGPKLIAAFHDKNFGINFDSGRDEYLTAWFATSSRGLKLADVRPEVGGFGVLPIDLHAREDLHWDVTFKLPPGLEAGFYDVRIRIGESAPGNARAIAVDLPLNATALRIESVCDGQTWRADKIDLRLGDTAALWISGLPKNADKNNVRVTIDGKPASVAYVQESGGSDAGARQVNVQVARAAAPGYWQLQASCGGVQSSPIPLQAIS